ncbi:hypothetical protein [Verrucomicrobium spinosum]|uniref:hypothetical protein n=1 Tax=Verrucomicrobium spinosum TaxID=2736 RepID=UPI0001746BC5|nr:hypothetical protein [Verrucomicrobium spinosum]
MEMIPPVPIKIATLDERLRASAAVPWERKLAAMKKQAGYLEDQSDDPATRALAYRESMRKLSKEA